MTELRSLIDEIKSNRMRLPEMQRAYIWKSTQVRDLLDSLYRNYPVGTILRWETTQKIPTRDFAVSQEDTKYESYYLLLDGQQRLTSLKAILCGEPVIVRGRKRAIDIYFNLDHPDKLENTKVATDDDNETEFEEDEDIKVTSDAEENKNRIDDMNRRAFVVENPLVKSQNNWISVVGVFSGKVDIQDIIKRAGDTTTLEGKKRLDKYLKRFQALQNIEHRDLQVQTLPASKSYEEVTEIFVRVNQAGKSTFAFGMAAAFDYRLISNDRTYLGQNDLLTSFPIDIRLGKGTIDHNVKLKQMIDDSPKLTHEFASLQANEDKLVVYPYDIDKTIPMINDSNGVKLSHIVIPQFDKELKTDSLQISVPENMDYVKQVIQNNCLTPNDPIWLQSLLEKDKYSKKELTDMANARIDYVMNNIDIFVVKYRTITRNTKRVSR